jgi:hypothetical protein
VHYYHPKLRPPFRGEPPPSGPLAPVQGQAFGALGRVLVGALAGVLLAAFATTVNGSTLGVTAVVLLGVILGGAAGRLPGAVAGAGFGGLAAFVLGAIGGSVFGGALAVVACALLAGWVGRQKHSPWGASLLRDGHLRPWLYRAPPNWDGMPFSDGR